MSKICDFFSILYPPALKIGADPPQLRPRSAGGAIYVTRTWAYIMPCFWGISRWGGGKAHTVCMPFPKPYEPTLSKIACKISIRFQSYDCKNWLFGLKDVFSCWGVLNRMQKTACQNSQPFGFEELSETAIFVSRTVSSLFFFSFSCHSSPDFTNPSLYPI